MKVTPLDIRRKEFKRSMRGYSDEEVDVFLDDVADEFERLFQENIELNDRVERLQEQISGHVQMKDALEKTLISAQLQSDEMKANARKESELILQEAELKAREIVRDSYGETQRVQQALIQLKHLEEDFRFKFRSLLEGHLKLLNEAPIGAPSSESRVLTGEVGGEAETPLVVPSPGTAEPEMVASDTVASEMVPSALAASEMSAAAEPFEEVAAPEDEIPTEETFTDEVAVAVAAADDSGNGAAQQEAVYSASTDGAEETTAETLAVASAAESTAESRTGETFLPETPPPASVAPAPVAPPRAAPETSMTATGETEIDETDEPTGGFFFGRQPDDIDDTFVPPEEEPQKARDFEW